MGSFFRRLSTRLYIVVSLCFTVAMLILISVSVKFQEQVLVDEAEHSLKQTADIFQVNLDVLLNTRRLSLLNLVNNLEQWPQPEHPTLQDDSALKQMFDHLWVVNVHGTVVDEWPRLGAIRENLNISQYEMFRRVREGEPFLLTKPQPSYYNNEPLVNAVMPMYNSDGSFLGAVVGAFSLYDNIVLNQIITTRVGETGYITIADKQGHVVGHPDPRMIGMHLTPVQSNLLHRAITQDWEGVERIADRQGSEMIQAISHLNAGHWLVGVQLSLDEAMQPVHQMRKVQWSLGLAALFISLILLSVIVNSYLRPLRSLNDEVEDVQAGKRKQLTEPKINELRQLVYRFNNLLAQNHATHLTLQQRQAFLDQILETSSAGLFMANTKGKIQYVNHRLTKITGYSAEDLKRDGFIMQLTDTQRSNYIKLVRDTIKNQVEMAVEVQLRHNDGELVWLSIETSPVNVDDTCIGHVGTITDISSQRARIAELLHAAHEDTLTGVFNRRGIEQLMTAAFQHAKASQQSLLVVALDLDNFKQINDNYGHAYGDFVLAEVAKLINRFTRDSDIVGRIGGDEFIIGLPNCPAERGHRVADEVIRGMQTLTTPTGHSAEVSVSIGMSAMRDDDESYLQILKRADEAAYKAKREGRNRYISTEV